MTSLLIDIGFLHFSFADLLDILMVAAIIYALFSWLKGSAAMNIFLAIVAGAPILLGNLTGTSIQLGGTSLLIVVGVALDTARALDGYMTARFHKGFLE